MNEPRNQLISISDIVSWMYCPRKLYLMRVKNLQQKPTMQMIIGKLRHNILENFSKSEKNLIISIKSDMEKLDLLFMYENCIKKSAERVFIDNMNMINLFMIDRQDVLKKTLNSFSEDLKIRISAIKARTSEGFFGEDLWKNLDTIYLSEVKLESASIGLRGRVDRIQLIRKDNAIAEIIPYELKSRAGNIFHSDEIQLTAYAMLLENFYSQKITKGIIESGNKKQPVEITEENKREVLKIADSIRDMLNNKSLLPPILSNFNKCRSCGFAEECPNI